MNQRAQSRISGLLAGQCHTFAREFLNLDSAGDFKISFIFFSFRVNVNAVLYSSLDFQTGNQSPMDKEFRNFPNKFDWCHLCFSH